MTNRLEPVVDSLQTWIPRAFVILVGLLLIGYAFGGRGFAHHTGIHPIYLSELALALGAIVIVVGLMRARWHWLWMAFALFVGFSAIHMLLTVPQYGSDSIRDAVIALYAVFALAIALIIRPEHLPQAARVYRYAVPLFLLWAPLAALIRRNAQDAVPSLPISDVGLVYYKAGDWAVHLTGIAGFVILGIMSTQLKTISWRWQIPLWLIWSIGVFMALNSRSAMLTILFGVLTAQFLYLTKPPEGRRSPTPLAMPWAFLIAILVGTVVFDVQAETGSGDVRIDGVYVLNGLTSLVGVTFVGTTERPPELDVDSAAAPEVDDDASTANDARAQPEFDRTSQRQLNTREWRLNWWRSIFEYTVTGEYFWTGKGFGINLADSDGFQVAQDPPLRSPHNVHATFLARMGVPGFLIWSGLQIAFAVAVFRVFLRRSAGREFDWIGASAGLVIVYWVAVMVNSSFDVYLEGPQGGIWFWSVVGLGLGLVGLDQSAQTCNNDRGSKGASRQGTSHIQDPVGNGRS